jgi:hypothetical protein
MAQLSRPFQIALAAVLLLACVWLFALQGHKSSTSTASTPTASAPSTPAPASSAAGTSAAGSNTTAPGVAGLSRAVAKAHQTVTASQQSAKQVEGESATAPTTTAAAPSTTKVTSVTTVHKSAAGKTTVHKVTTVHKTPSKSGAAAIPARQLTVEAALEKGNIVVILFWNHHGADDVAVQRALKPLAKSGRKISVQEVAPGQVAAFGSVTRGVQVYGTPTILIVNKHGQTTTLTGLQDTYSIQQAIAEAR